MGTFII